MINHYQKRARHPFLTFAIFGLLVLLATFRPVHAQEADPKTAAVAAMQVWLLGVDEGRYAASWTASAPSFQKALTSGKWVAALDSVRKPLGNCVSRKLASALLQSAETDIVIAQFETSFSNMKYAIETVSFERDGDVWKAAGYYIKPAL